MAQSDVFETADHSEVSAVHQLRANSRWANRAREIRINQFLVLCLNQEGSRRTYAIVNETHITAGEGTARVILRIRVA